MISLYELKNKLNKQAKEFAFLLELPDIYAQGLWASGVFNCPQFSEAHNRLSNTFEENDLASVLAHDYFKYLLINDYDDRDIIESLHQQVAAMATRVEKLMLVDIETLELVSVIYRVLGLPDESKFIVNSGAEFRLGWQPYFKDIAEPQSVLYADLALHGISYRLIATKFPFQNLSMENIQKYMYISHLNNECEYEGCTSSGNTYTAHEAWLLKTLEYYQNGKLSRKPLTPTSFKIDGMRYVVFGFPIVTSPSNDSNQHKPELKMQIKKLDGVQKFVVRIDQQLLVFCARRVETDVFSTFNSKTYFANLRESLLSHHNAEQKLVDVEAAKYLTLFRPYCLEDKAEVTL